MTRFSRRAGIRITVAAVVVVAAVVGLWWKPWQSATLPQSACWGMLSRDDLKPLAGADGTAGVRTSGNTPVSLLKSGPKPLTLPDAECAVSWNRNKTLLMVSVDPQSTADMQGAEEQGLQSQAPNNLGSGILLLWQGNTVIAFFRCGGITWPDSPYAEVEVSGGSFPLSGDDQYAPKSDMDAYASIALKVSKAIAKQLPCTNTLTFPQSAPTDTATPPSWDS